MVGHLIQVLEGYLERRDQRDASLRQEAVQHGLLGLGQTEAVGDPRHDAVGDLVRVERQPGAQRRTECAVALVGLVKAVVEEGVEESGRDEVPDALENGVLEGSAVGDVDQRREDTVVQPGEAGVDRVKTLLVEFLHGMILEICLKVFGRPCGDEVGERFDRRLIRILRQQVGKGEVIRDVFFQLRITFDLVEQFLSVGIGVGGHSDFFENSHHVDLDDARELCRDLRNGRLIELADCLIKEFVERGILVQLVDESVDGRRVELSGNFLDSPLQDACPDDAGIDRVDVHILQRGDDLGERDVGDRPEQIGTGEALHRQHLLAKGVDVFAVLAVLQQEAVEVGRLFGHIDRNSDHTAVVVDRNVLGEQFGDLTDARRASGQFKLKQVILILDFVLLRLVGDVDAEGNDLIAVLNLGEVLERRDLHGDDGHQGLEVDVQGVVLRVLLGDGVAVDLNLCHLTQQSEERLLADLPDLIIGQHAKDRCYVARVLQDRVGKHRGIRHSHEVKDQLVPVIDVQQVQQSLIFVAVQRAVDGVDVDIVGVGFSVIGSCDLGLDLTDQPLHVDGVGKRLAVREQAVQIDAGVEQGVDDLIQIDVCGVGRLVPIDVRQQQIAHRVDGERRLVIEVILSPVGRKVVDQRSHTDQIDNLGQVAEIRLDAIVRKDAVVIDGHIGEEGGDPGGEIGPRHGILHGRDHDALDVVFRMSAELSDRGIVNRHSQGERIDLPVGDHPCLTLGGQEVLSVVLMRRIAVDLAVELIDQLGLELRIAEQTGDVDRIGFDIVKQINIQGVKNVLQIQRDSIVGDHDVLDGIPQDRLIDFSGEIGQQVRQRDFSDSIVLEEPLCRGQRGIYVADKGIASKIGKRLAGPQEGFQRVEVPSLCLNDRLDAVGAERGHVDVIGKAFQRDDSRLDQRIGQHVGTDGVDQIVILVAVDGVEDPGHDVGDLLRIQFVQNVLNIDDRQDAVGPAQRFDESGDGFLVAGDRIHQRFDLEDLQQILDERRVTVIRRRVSASSPIKQQALKRGEITGQGHQLQEFVLQFCRTGGTEQVDQFVRTNRKDGFSVSTRPHGLILDQGAVRAVYLDGKRADGKRRQQEKRREDHCKYFFPEFHAATSLFL